MLGGDVMTPTRSTPERELIALLHSLKEDAHWAWMVALEGNDTSAVLAELGKSWKQLEHHIIMQDATKR